jgi:uncharacterized membrane protein SpoIIM required for sporulation
MILNLDRFLARERPLWNELDQMLSRVESTPGRRLDFDEAVRLHYLYERAASDLGKLNTFAGESLSRTYLESLVARAYGEIHSGRGPRSQGSVSDWFFVEFPATFRRHAGYFWVAFLISIAGAVFGAASLIVDPDSRSATMAYGHDRTTPSERVRREESGHSLDAGSEAALASELMTHNTQVSIQTLGLGMTWGIGTVISLFYNGVILGAVCADYIREGQTLFLAGWILPHGSIELPALLIAGQAGLLLGTTLIGRGSSLPIRQRLRLSGRDLATLILGVAVLLIWAALVEAFFSQHHEPKIPYPVKVGFGLLQLLLLASFLFWSGRGSRKPSQMKENR